MSELRKPPKNSRLLQIKTKKRLKRIQRKKLMAKMNFQLWMKAILLIEMKLNLEPASTKKHTKTILPNLS